MEALLEDPRGSQATNSGYGNGLDPLLAVQLSDRPRYDAWSGEARLALAIVEDAIMTVRVAQSVRTARGQRLAAEAWAWIVSREHTHPFAFENLCDYLGLNAAWLRSGLRLGGYGGDSLLPATPRGGRRARRRLAEPDPRTRARA